MNDPASPCDCKFPKKWHHRVPLIGRTVGRCEAEAWAKYRPLADLLVKRFQSEKTSRDYICERFINSLVKSHAFTENANYWGQRGRWGVAGAAVTAPTLVGLSTQTSGIPGDLFKGFGIGLTVLAGVVGAGVTARRAEPTSRIFGKHNRLLEALAWKYTAGPADSNPFKGLPGRSRGRG